MNYPMNYPKFPEFNKVRDQITEIGRLKYEYGADRAGIQTLIDEAENQLKSIKEKLLALPNDKVLAENEPDNLEEIRALRPGASRKLWKSFDEKKYADRLKGAILGRFAGCILGSPVEFWSVNAMKDWAEYIGDTFPPVDYWSDISTPNFKRYGVSECIKYTKKAMDRVPVDDDITYTVLGLLIAEDAGVNFTVEDVGKAWLKYLPHACTAEGVALNNLKAGIDAMKVADINNPYVQWIGADIRSDSWGYMAPGLPEKAAEMAHTDAYISHRRNGIYGEMYFSAVIAAAFDTDKIIDALKAGLNEIPQNCLLANDVKWALEAGNTLTNYIDARKITEDRFGGMHGVHTNLNACLTIFGLMIGGDDFTKVIGETVAMGYDNDCTAATAGSIFGAVKGINAIPAYWYEPFNNKVLTYINGLPEFSIDDIFQRFAKQASEVFDTL